MLHLVEISEIKNRAEAINLTLKRLCKAADVDPSTAYRGVRPDGGETRSGTLRKLTAALEAAELAVAFSLLELPHIKQAIADRAAAAHAEKAA